MLVSAAMVGGCVGDGCSCAGPIPGGFPPESRVENTMQVRVSDSGLAALTQDPAALIEGFVGPEGLTIDVPPACDPNDDPKICCDGDGNPIMPCGPIEIDLEPRPGDAPRLEIDPVSGQSRLDVQMRARVRTKNDLPIEKEVLFLTVSCDVAIDTEASGDDDVLVTLPLSFTEDAAAGTTRLEVGQVSLDQFQNGDIQLSGGIDCDIADLLVFAFRGLLVGVFEDQIESTVSDQVCKSCDDVAECGAFADACEGGTCMRGDQCVQELGISARLPAASVLGDTSPGTMGALDLYEVAGGYADTDNGGISLGFLGGGLPASGERDRCGPSATAPESGPLPVSSFFTGNTRPDTGDPFDFSVGIHQHNIDLLAWSAYESGFLCLNIGTRSVELLNSDTLAIVMPSLIDFLHGEVAQMVLGLRPQRPPVIALGPGTFIDDGNGGRTIDEPLLDITMPELAIDFYAQVEDQFIRIMTLTSDVHLPMSLDVSPEGELIPVLGDLDNAFANLRVENSEALYETPDELATRFPAVLDLALPLLIDGLGSFALPELGGITLRVDSGGITSVDDNSFLAIFGSFELPQMAAAAPAGGGKIVTTASLTSIHVPEREAFTRPTRDARPRIDLKLGGYRPNGTAAELEWAVRLNGGPWSPFSRSERVTLSRESLWLQARHRVEVRAREVGKSETTDPSPVVLEPIIDVIPPHVVLSRPNSSVGALRDSVWVLGTDNVSKGRLRGRYRLGDRSWQAITLPAEIELAGAGAGEELQVELVDEAGNNSRATMVVENRERGGSAAPATATIAAGCSVGGDAGGGPVLLLLLVAALWSLRRRARWLVVGAALLMSAGCGGKGECDVSGGEVEPGAIGRYSSVAALGQRAVVAAYEQDLGDLVLFEINRDGALGAPEVIDGVPADAAPVFASCSYRGGIAGAGDDVGAHTSVALTGSEDRPTAMVAYQDIGNGQLKFAREDGSDWQVHVVDAESEGVAGLYTSLAVDPDGIPAIAYMVTGLPGQAGARRAELRYARATTTTPDSSTDWTVSVVDSAGVSCAGMCGAGESCVDSDGDHLCVTPGDDCAGGCAEESACVGGTCLAVVPAPVAHDLPPGTGLFADLSYLPDGRPVVAYYDRTTTDLMVMVGGASWTAIAVDAAAQSDTGMWTSAAMDAAGTLHVAYQDALADQLLYTTWSEAGVGPVEVVDDGVRPGDRPHPVGASAALFLDSGGNPAIAYQDGLSHDMLLARRDGSSWARESLAAGPAVYGFYIDAATAGDRTWISSFQYDRAAPVLGELFVTSAP